MKQRRFTVHQTTNAAEFMSASHSVGPGLIGWFTSILKYQCDCLKALFSGSGIVSAWTWAATLLQCVSPSCGWSAHP